VVLPKEENADLVIISKLIEKYYPNTKLVEKTNDYLWTATLDLDSCHSKKRIGFPAISVGNFEAA